nr:cardiotrophin-like cytokine factor 1 [Nerophis lumbriciformis]
MGEVHQLYFVLLLGTVANVDSFHSLASERSSIESTYELTKYLEYQLKEIKDVYLTYLGPPFNDKDFSPPRPNSTALSLPSAATRLELWRGLENQARLAQNQRAYSILLAAVRELARSTLCPSLKISLLHFCTGLDGLLGSISALMTTLGYALPEKKPGDLQWGVGPAMNDFARKVEGFWILRELQSWLWRSAKDFNRLKRRLRG